MTNILTRAEQKEAEKLFASEGGFDCREYDKYLSPTPCGKCSSCLARLGTAACDSLTAMEEIVEAMAAQPCYCQVQWRDCGTCPSCKARAILKEREGPPMTDLPLPVERPRRPTERG